MNAVEPDIRELSTKVAAASEPFRRLLDQMHRVIVGQDELLHRMLVGLLSRDQGRAGPVQGHCVARLWKEYPRSSTANIGWFETNGEKAKGLSISGSMP